MYSIILAASISAVVAVAIYAVVTNLVIKTSIRKRREAAVKEAGIEVVGRPDPEVVSMSEDEGATLKVKVAVKPEVELGEYAGLTVTKEAKNVNEADVDAEVKRMQDRNGRLLTREGAAENGDTVDIDFEGFVDGKAFEGGKARIFDPASCTGCGLCAHMCRFGAIERRGE